MGCLRLTYDNEPNLFLQEQEEKVEAVGLRVWINPDGVFSEVGINVLTQDGTPWLDYAFGENGVTECKKQFGFPDGSNLRILEYFNATSLVPVKDNETAWCAAFANWCLKQAGISGSNSASSWDWEKWGQKLSAPAYGAIAVTTTGHTSFVIGGHDSYLILYGGNQSDMVKATDNYYTTGDIKFYVYPNGFTPCYDLPSSIPAILKK